MKIKINHVNIMKPVEFVVEFVLDLFCVVSINSVLHPYKAC